MTEIAREFGRQGGKKAARNSTPEERSARAKIGVTGSGEEADGGSSGAGTQAGSEEEVSVPEVVRGCAVAPGAR